MSNADFHGSAAPSLGVELELQLIDAETLALREGAGEILNDLAGSIRGFVKPELYRCCIEINTGVSADVAAVGLDLAGKLEAVERLAARHGLRVGWGGTHPFSSWVDQPMTLNPRYHELAEQFRETITRQLTFGMHVHVGVRTGDEAVRACTRLRGYLPVLLALSANSPFWCGRPTGLLSYRSELVGAPSGGLPPRLGGWAEFVALLDRMIERQFIKSHKELWWDARPSPKLGTVEVRICDMPPDLPTVLGLTALVQCLVTHLATEEAGTAADPSLELMLGLYRWRAARYGLEARLFDPADGSAVVARELVRTLVGRLGPIAARLGCADELERVGTLAARPTGSERQLDVFRSSGDLVAVARSLVDGPRHADRLEPVDRREPAPAQQPWFVSSVTVGPAGIVTRR